MPLMAINTLEEASAFLTSETKEQWTPQSVLDFARRNIYQPRGRPRPVAYAAMPLETQFGVYKWDTNEGTPANPFHRQHSASWRMVPLFPYHAGQLLLIGETVAGMAESPDSERGQEGCYVFLEPLEAPPKITLDMVRMKEADIRAIVNQCRLERLESGVRWAMQELTDETANDWLAKPCWSFAEGLMLLFGVAIEAQNTTDLLPHVPLFGQASDLLNRAIISGQLKPVNPGGNPLAFAPGDFISAASRLRIGGWEHWKRLLGNSATDAASDTPEKAVTVTTCASMDRDAIMKLFPLEGDEEANRKRWEPWLSDPKNKAKWLCEAKITNSGKPGTSAQWNPLLVAVALVFEWKPRQPAIKKLQPSAVIVANWFKKSAPHLEDQWKEIGDQYG